jgi:hypothetical protein
MIDFARLIFKETAANRTALPSFPASRVTTTKCLVVNVMGSRAEIAEATLLLVAQLTNLIRQSMESRAVELASIETAACGFKWTKT